MSRRKIVRIDEEKCNGCGLCVPACAEGALQIINGKARLVSDVYCDGLGACLGDCPQDAITIEEREADAFDEELVQQHLADSKPPATAGGCPGAAPQSLQLPMVSPAMPGRESAGDEGPSEASPSQLGNWPLQLHLVPPGAPWLADAEVLLVADCVPFALADFHDRFLRRNPVVIGCPKLDDGRAYVEKLTDMLVQSQIKRITVVRMEVPCCTGLIGIAQEAIRNSGRGVPLEEVTISIRGRIVEPAE